MKVIGYNGKEIKPIKVKMYKPSKLIKEKIKFKDWHYLPNEFKPDNSIRGKMDEYIANYINNLDKATFRIVHSHIDNFEQIIQSAKDGSLQIEHHSDKQIIKLNDNIIGTIDIKGLKITRIDSTNSKFISIGDKQYNQFKQWHNQQQSIKDKNEKETTEKNRKASIIKG